jgi:hypothetical protein
MILTSRLSLRGNTMTKATGLPRLTSGQRLALTGAVGLALALATYGAVGSYTTISTKAAELGVPLPALVPVGIDGGLVGVIVLDLVLAWTGHPIGWLRQLTRLLTIGTVTANVSAGWPNPIAIGLHAAAPLMLLVMVEAGRAVLLRRAGLASGTVRDRIPMGRWVLSPWRTWLLWRRMVLWQISSYREALDMDARLHRARHVLMMHFGRHWKREAPADVVWMLGIPPFAEEACALVDVLVGGEKQRAIAPPDTAEASKSVSAASREPDDVDVLEKALRINESHWAQRSRPVSAETLRKHLHVGAARARELTSMVRAKDRASVEQGLTTALD